MFASSLYFNFRSTWPYGTTLSSNSKSSNQNAVFINVTFWLVVSLGVSRKFYCHEALSQFDFAETCIVKKFRCCFYFNFVLVLFFLYPVLPFTPNSLWSKFTLHLLSCISQWHINMSFYNYLPLIDFHTTKTE